VDIVPDTVTYAAQKYPNTRFLCQDLLEEPLREQFDYVFLSGVFNNTIPSATEFLKELVSISFQHCTTGLAFNFTSTYVNYRDAGMAYHDPIEVLDFCLKNLSRKLILHNHYEHCDVAVFLYR